MANHIVVADSAPFTEGEILGPTQSHQARMAGVSLLPIDPMMEPDRITFCKRRFGSGFTDQRRRGPSVALYVQEGIEYRLSWLVAVADVKGADEPRGIVTLATDPLVRGVAHHHAAGDPVPLSALTARRVLGAESRLVASQTGFAAFVVTGTFERTRFLWVAASVCRADAA